MKRAQRVSTDRKLIEGKFLIVFVNATKSLKFTNQGRFILLNAD